MNNSSFSNMHLWNGMKVNSGFRLKKEKEVSFKC